MNTIKALGQYPTPVGVAEALVERHFRDLDSNDVVVEPSCGNGSFLGVIPPHVQALGVDPCKPGLFAARYGPLEPSSEADRSASGAAGVFAAPDDPDEPTLACGDCESANIPVALEPDNLKITLTSEQLERFGFSPGASDELGQVFFAKTLLASQMPYVMEHVVDGIHAHECNKILLEVCLDNRMYLTVLGGAYDYVDEGLTADSAEGRAFLQDAGFVFDEPSA